MTTKNIDLKRRGGSKKPTLYTLHGVLVVAKDVNTTINQYI
jgi:NAD-dependent SIR2 family protein deacetylase